ncbi:MAG: chemotaxis protein CheX [Oligoflexia bacterium]|nr:chemotaxis protein CheX [Oligoflexia bacterium]
MDAGLINPFIQSTVNVLSTMAQTSPTVGQAAIKKGHKTWGCVTGIIGMAGKEVTGNLVVSFDEGSILGIVSKMLMEEFKEINKDVVDAVGEITNMISGGTKKLLSEKGFSFDMATPVILVGKDIEMTQLSKSPVLCVPFKTDRGQFVLEANLAKRA